jgi:hypothetical protein
MGDVACIMEEAFLIDSVEDGVDVGWVVFEFLLVLVG